MADDPHYISNKDAAALTARWRQNMPAGGTHAARFDRVAFDNLLSQPGCAGIRIYMGMEPQPTPGNPSAWTLVLVGTDAAGNDMVSPSSDDSGGGTEQYPFLCPPYCGDASPLNQP